MAQGCRGNAWVWSALLLAGVGGAGTASASAAFTAGQSVEVREGDSWSAATVVKREGRRYLIHYAGSDASTDEWVGPDRIKGSGAAAPPETPATSDTPAAPPQRHRPALRRHDNHGDDAPEEVIPQVEADRSAIDAEQPDDAPASWGVTPDPAAKPAVDRGLKFRPPTSTDDDGREQTMGLTQLLPCRDGGAILGFAVFGEKGRGVVRVGTTAPAARASLPAVSLPIAASPSGTLLVCRCKQFGFGNNGRIDAYTLTPGHAEATPLVSFTPYPSDGRNGKPEDVRFAAALSDTRLVTCDLKGRLTAWDVSAQSVRGVWSTNVGPDMHFGGDDTNDLAVSPGGKWIVAAGRGIVRFVDAATGRVAGTVRFDSKRAIYDLCWSPSGRTVMARGDDGMLVVIDVTTGREPRTVQLPNGNQSSRQIGGITFFGGGDGGPLSCPDDGFALVGGKTLVDATNGAAVPSFHPPISGWPVLTTTGAGVTLLAGDGRLLATHLPADADRAAAASGTDLVLQPGMSVALDINLDGLSDADRSAVEAALRKRLSDDGFTIAPSADTTVVVRTEPGQPHEHYYGKVNGPFPMMLPPGSGTSIIVTDKVTRVTLQQKGQTIWEQKRTSEPGARIEMKDGQSMEDAVKASVTYDVKFLEQIAIPPYIAKASGE